MKLFLNHINSLHLIFLLFGIIFSGILMFKINNPITLNIKSTYYVISNKIILISFLLYFLSLTILYFYKATDLNNLLTRSHILITILTLAIMLILYSIMKEDSQNYDIVTFIKNKKFNSNIRISLLILSIIFLLSQLLFIINFIMSFFRKPF